MTKETEPEYISEDTILNYVCPNGSLGATTWAMWEKGDRCNCDLCRRDREDIVSKIKTEDNFI